MVAFSWKLSASPLSILRLGRWTRSSLSTCQEVHFPHAKRFTFHMPRSSLSTCQEVHSPHAKKFTFHMPRSSLSTCQEVHFPHVKKFTFHMSRSSLSTCQEVHFPHAKKFTFHMPRSSLYGVFTPGSSTIPVLYYSLIHTTGKSTCTGKLLWYFTCEREKCLKVAER